MFSQLRKLLGAIGLLPEAVDDIVERMNGFLSEEEQSREWQAFPGTPLWYIYLRIPQVLSPGKNNRRRKAALEPNPDP